MRLGWWTAAVPYRPSWQRAKNKSHYKSVLEGVTGPTGLLSVLVTVWTTLMARVAISSLLTVATAGVLTRNTVT